MACTSKWQRLLTEFQNAYNTVSFNGKAAILNDLSRITPEKRDALRHLERLMASSLTLFLRQPTARAKYAAVLTKFGGMSRALWEQMAAALQDDHLSQADLVDCLKLIRQTYRKEQQREPLSADVLLERVQQRGGKIYTPMEILAAAAFDEREAYVDLAVVCLENRAHWREYGGEQWGKMQDALEMDARVARLKPVVGDIALRLAENDGRRISLHPLDPNALNVAVVDDPYSIYHVTPHPNHIEVLKDGQYFRGKTLTLKISEQARYDTTGNLISSYAHYQLDDTTQAAVQAPAVQQCVRSALAAAGIAVEEDQVQLTHLKGWKTVNTPLDGPQEGVLNGTGSMLCVLQLSGRRAAGIAISYRLPQTIAQPNDLLDGWPQQESDLLMVNSWPLDSETDLHDAEAVEACHPKEHIVNELSRTLKSL